MLCVYEAIRRTMDLDCSLRMYLESRSVLALSNEDLLAFMLSTERSRTSQETKMERLLEHPEGRERAKLDVLICKCDLRP